MKVPASGRFVLRLPTQLHAALRERAAAEGLSLNQLCRQALSEFLAADRTPASSGPEAPWLRASRDLLGEELWGAVLFGSEARGEARRDSDIDLLLVTGPEVPLSRRLYTRWDEKLPDGRHSPHFVHLPVDPSAAGSLWLEAAVDGVLLYDRDGRVARFLGKVRRAIASGRLKRKAAYGHPYWVKSEGGPIHDQ